MRYYFERRYPPRATGWAVWLGGSVWRTTDVGSFEEQRQVHPVVAMPDADLRPGIVDL